MFTTLSYFTFKSCHRVCLPSLYTTPFLTKYQICFSLAPLSQRVPSAHNVPHTSVPTSKSTVYSRSHPMLLLCVCVCVLAGVDMCIHMSTNDHMCTHLHQVHTHVHGPLLSWDERSLTELEAYCFS